ncbi:hypothetical protein AB0H83_01840 [Dactylosporangium sp. NPDC050688]|uniref:hypothetical protein n=1 Tax=Dactylosporangium sp. NPDC050688 TaxID=3157217 RepID=UPI0033F9842E
MTAQWKKGKRRAESVAEDAWEYLVSAVESARSVGGSVKDRAYGIAGEASDRYSSASDRVGSVADEAWHRASLAFDALSGRKQRKPWGWVAVAVLGGIAVGWAVAASAPKAIQAAQERFEDEEDVPSPTYEAPAAYRVAE